MVNRNKVQAAVFSVDMGDQFADHALELWRVSESWAGHLDQDNIPNPFRVILQELFESAELLRIEIRSIEIKLKGRDPPSG